jgi:RHS repeat-associated protein
MATYDLLRHQAALRITDVPVGYAPPRGPEVEFRVTYNHRQPDQPQTFSFSNLGYRWSHDFLAYVEDDPANPNANVRIVQRGGGIERHTGFNGQTFVRHWGNFNVVARTSPASYEVRHPDGSVDVYAQPDGAMTSPRRVFLTRIIDAQGLAADLTYDAELRLVAITDAIGQVTTLAYENVNDPLKITRVTDPFGRSAVFAYDSSGALVMITDVLGLAAELRYGSGDFIAALTTPHGTASFRAEQPGLNGPAEVFRRMVEATDPLGANERIEYRFRVDDGTGPASVEPDEQVPTGFADQNRGLDVANTYYWDKRAMALYPGDYSKARVTRWLKVRLDRFIIGHWINMLVPVPHSEKQPLEGRVWYAYAGAIPSQFYLAATDPVTEIGDTAQPSMVARVLDDGSSQIHRYEYNSKGKTTRSTDPLGRATVYVYAPNEIDLLEVRQVRGTQTELLASYTYDKHQILTATDAAGQTTTYTYTTDNQIHTVTNAKSETTTYSYNSDGQLTSVTGPVAGTTTTYEYDGYGRLWRVTDPEGYAVTTDYDALDRPTRVTYPDGTYEETTYDKLDASRHRDRQGRWTETFYDALRRPVATRDAAGRTTQKNEWVSCPSGCGGAGAKLSKLVDANGNATTWEYDVEGRVTSETRANSAEYAYAYENTTSRLKSVQDPNGNVKTYAYNRDNSLAAITYQPGAGVAATPSVGFTYDPVYNRVAAMTDGTGSTAYTYYPTGVLGAGRLQSVDGPLDNDTIEYGYDQLGRVTSRLIGESSNTQSQQFDSLGRLTQITNPLGNFVYAYDGVTGRPTSVTYPNGQATTYAYLDNLGDHRLQEIHNKKPGGATLSKFNYTYDKVGNITTWRQQTESNPAQVYEFGYDPADQLTAAILKSTDPTPALLKRYYYAYDPAGNRTAEQIDDSVKSWTYNNMNQLVTEQAGGALIFKGTVNEAATVTVGGKPATVTADNRFAGAAVVAPSGTTDVQVTATDYASPTRNTRTNTYRVSQSGTPKSFTFDSNGNMTSDGTKSYVWDAENRLVEVKQGATTLASFTYKASSIRASKTAGGVTTIYVIEGNSVVEERLNTGGATRHFEGPGIDNVLATMDATGASSYYVRDHLGSMRQRTDSTGQVTLTRDYDPWGSGLAGPTVGGSAFTGREWDTEAGLYYYRARYYDPTVGRFMGEDPAALGASVSGSDLNRYAYASNSPVVRIDPSGLQGVPPGDAGRLICWFAKRGPTRQQRCYQRLLNCRDLCMVIWLMAAGTACTLICAPLMPEGATAPAGVACWISCRAHLLVPYILCGQDCDAEYRQCMANP